MDFFCTYFAPLIEIMAPSLTATTGFSGLQSYNNSFSMHFCPTHYSKSRDSLFIGFMTNGPVGLRGGGVEESKIE